LNVKISKWKYSDSAVEHPNEFPKLVEGGGWTLENGGTK